VTGNSRRNSNTQSVLRKTAAKFLRRPPRDFIIRPIPSPAKPKPHYAEHRDRKEQFRVLFLDRKNRLIADEVLGHGTIDRAPVYPREIVKRALALEATAIILAHNHPSGDPTPSQADMDMTFTIVETCQAVGISVHDHLVIGREEIASFKMLGLM